MTMSTSNSWPRFERVGTASPWRPSVKAPPRCRPTRRVHVAIATPTRLALRSRCSQTSKKGDNRWLPGPWAVDGFRTGDHLSPGSSRTTGPSYRLDDGERPAGLLDLKPIRTKALHPADQRQGRTVPSKPSCRNGLCDHAYQTSDERNRWLPRYPWGSITQQVPQALGGLTPQQMPPAAAIAGMTGEESTLNQQRFSVRDGRKPAAQSSPQLLNGAKLAHPSR